MGSLPKGISGSRSAAILNLSDYQSQFEVWQVIEEERCPGFNERRGYVLPEKPDNAAIRWGHAFEDAVIELCEAQSGAQITHREHFFERDYLTCHVDGLYSTGPMHEGKTTSMMNWWDSWGEPGTDRIPQGYQCQAQHNLMLCERPEAIVSVLVFPRRVDEWEAEGWRTHGPLAGNIRYELEKWQTVAIPPDKPDILRNSIIAQASCRDWARVIAEMGLFHQYPVAASPTLQRTLADAYRHFWHTYVLPEREPEIDAYADIRRAFPAPKGTLIATETEERWTAEYRQIGEEISTSGRLGKRREELKVLILKSMRARDGTIDDESREKTVLRDSQGRKLASWDGKTFR